MKRSFAVVTDSTADLPGDWRRRYDIEVVPLKVIFGDETFRDGVDMKRRSGTHRVTRGIAPRNRHIIWKSDRSVQLAAGRIQHSDCLVQFFGGIFETVDCSAQFAGRF